MRRYEELLQQADNAIDDYDPAKAEMWLGLARTRRKACELPFHLMEEDIVNRLQELQKEYPVPEGCKLRPGGPGCGDPKCESCYTSATPRRK